MNKYITWITDGSAQPFYTRKNIKIKKSIQKATVHVCGLGQFVFYINGRKVGDHELDPGWTDYRKAIEYVTFDVTSYLTEGKNALGAEIGNGWFIMDKAGGYSFDFPGFMPPNPNPYCPYGKALIFAMELLVEYEDGEKERFCTDKSWKVAPHEVCHTNVYGSEIVDAALQKKGFSELGYKDDDWKNAFELQEKEIPCTNYIEQTHPEIKVIKSYKGTYLHTAAQKEIYDFSQNMSFLLSFDIKGKKGDIVKIYPAEKLDQDGMVDQMAKNWMMIDTVLEYTIGETEEWESYREKFTYFAGQYIAVEKSSSDIELRNITAHAITSAWENVGVFESDDLRYQQIYSLVEKSVEANMVSVHTDCPTIERFAWQEPNHLMAPAIMYMKNGKSLWKKFLMDMRLGQHGKEDIFQDYEGNELYPGDGLVPSQCPCYIPNVIPVPGMGSFYDIIPWGSSIILATRWHYIFYGDKSVIEENYQAGKRYLAHLKTKMTEDGFINHGLGDWGNPEQILARENVETAFLYADAKTLAEFAELLGEKEDEKAFRLFAEAVKENYNRKLLTKMPDGKYVYRCYECKEKIVTSQACEALPLYWGMVPKEAKADVCEAFRNTLIEKNGFVSGEVGMPYIIQTASQYGMNELISQYITKPEHPSYYAFVLDGMKTLGEYWEKNPRSHCHDMMGHIIEWYYNGIAGIKPLEAGFKKVLIKPYLPNSMNHMKCTFQSVSGMILIEMTRQNETIVLDVTCDENIEYVIDRSLL